MIRQSVIRVADLLIAMVVNLTHEVIPVFHITRTGYNYYKLLLTVRVINMINLYLVQNNNCANFEGSSFANLRIYFQHISFT